jgi:hypothetical protein
MSHHFKHTPAPAPLRPSLIPLSLNLVLLIAFPSLHSQSTTPRCTCSVSDSPPPPSQRRCRLPHAAACDARVRPRVLHHRASLHKLAFRRWANERGTKRGLQGTMGQGGGGTDGLPDRDIDHAARRDCPTAVDTSRHGARRFWQAGTDPSALTSTTAIDLDLELDLAIVIFNLSPSLAQ